MRRCHLFELEDLPWLPAPVRDGATDYLAFLQKLLRPYAPCQTLLNETLAKSGAKEILDLCSGAGGPLPELAMALRTREGAQPPITLSDKFPNSEARKRFDSSASLRYLEQPVDARQPPADIHALRTLFTAFHHFRPMDAQAIVTGAVSANQPIAIFELTERTWGSFLRVALLTCAQFLLTPFAGSAQPSRYIFTYLLPLIPLVVFWDGVASTLRSYTTEELRRFAASASGNYEWSVGRLPSVLGAGMTYLIGIPRES